MRTLFPPIKPYNKHIISVSDGHSLYVEECGEPKGIPILFVHGGPGAGCSSDDRRFFDPERYRIILFDQRGCGRSKPYASVKDNTSQLLISDIETIRAQLKVDRWFLFGGSWGSTLSLLYAQEHVERVRGMVLRGIFLCRQQDFDWFYKPGGASHVFPDYWADFVRLIPEKERGDLMKAYHKRLNGYDELARMDAAKHWSRWEGSCATLHPSRTVTERFTNPHTAMSLARIESHYFMNKAFLEENQILENMPKLADVPGVIVHGRYDMICPLDNAKCLQDSWPNSELFIVRDGGHSAMEPGNAHALIKATQTIADFHYK